MRLNNDGDRLLGQRGTPSPRVFRAMGALVKQTTELERLSSVVWVNPDLAIPSGHKSYDPAGSHSLPVGKG